MTLSLNAVQLLGKDHQSYGAVESQLVGSQAAVAVSVGADKHSPSLEFKGDVSVANEDALCLVDAGDWIALAVADAHFGHEASHNLIKTVYETLLVSRPHDLRVIAFSLFHGPKPATRSETTLLMAVFDRLTGKGFGLSFGDSTMCIISADGQHQIANHRNNRYVASHSPALVEAGSAFTFAASPGSLIVAHTDGIDECHYRRPGTSIQPSHMVDVAESCDLQPGPFVDRLTQLALRGVNGHPGGQDNIAVVAAAA